MDTRLVNSAGTVNNLRSIALPAQHGIWGFWLEPSLAALITAPSWAGLCLSLAGLGLLLLHHPFTIWIKDRRRGKLYGRTVWAERFALIYGSGALLCFALAFLIGERAFVAALGLALPFAAVQLAMELRNQTRNIAAELGGAAALATLAPAIVLAGGGSAGAALGVWAIMLLRAGLSIPYIRTRLLLEKGKPAQPASALALHAVGVVLLLVLAAIGVVPWLAVVGVGIMLARAVGGLTQLRKPTPARILGFRELGYGLVLAVLVGVGFRL